MASFISLTDLPNVTVSQRGEPPTPHSPLLPSPPLSSPLLSSPVPSTPATFFSSPLLFPPVSSSPPRGGSADSYILGRSRSFLAVSAIPAGLWPRPDGQRQSDSLPRRPARTHRLVTNTYKLEGDGRNIPDGSSFFSTVKVFLFCVSLSCFGALSDKNL